MPKKMHRGRGSADTRGRNKVPGKAAIAKKWAVRRFRHGSAAGVVFLDFSFPTADGVTSRLCVPYSDLRRPRVLLGQFWDRLAFFPDGADASDKEALAFLNRLVSGQLDPIEIVPDRTGFIDKSSYATFTEVLTGKGRRPIVRTDQNPQIAGDIRGSLKDSRKGVLEVARKSTYLAFGIGVALAAPLPSYLRLAEPDAEQFALTETAAFNFSGPSGAGKTSIAKAAQSLSCNPERTGTMNFSERGLAEYAAANNDMVLVLDDTEKTSRGLADTLRHAIHGVSGGRSKMISRDGDAAKYPELRWSTLGLSSSPRPIPLVSADAGRPLTRGDLVRLFDIPVPAPARGGIFDRVSGATRKRARKSIKLIARLEQGYRQNYGHVFAYWIEYLLKNDRRQAITKAVQKFVDHVQANGDGWEKRFAQKFGLVYAALKLAVAAGILPWSDKFSLKVVVKCYRSARRSAMTEADLVRYHCRRLSRRLRKPRAMIDHPGSGQSVTIPRSCIALRYKKAGRLIVGVFDDALLKITGTKAAKSILTKALFERGILREGHGHAGTVQEHLPIVRDTESNARPHVWAFDYRRFHKLSAP